jgi:hypothetical protein
MSHLAKKHVAVQQIPHFECQEWRYAISLVQQEEGLNEKVNSFSTLDHQIVLRLGEPNALPS